MNELFNTDSFFGRSIFKTYFIQWDKYINPTADINI